MRLSFVDLKRHPKKLIEALERNETVTLSRRGRDIARIVPMENEECIDITKHPSFGIWKDREDLADPTEWVANLRSRRRFDDL